MQNTQGKKAANRNCPGKSPDCTYQTTLNHHFKYVQRRKIYMFKEPKESMRIMSYQIKSIKTEKEIVKKSQTEILVRKV